MTTSCNSFHLIITNDQCGNIAANTGISLADFYLWNPAVGSSCGSLWAGYYVCINVLGGPTPTTSSVASMISPGNGVATPTPTQPGMTTSCNAFHLVKTGDQCGTIAASAGISLANFYAWNPSVGTTCTTLFAEDYVAFLAVQYFHLHHQGSIAAGLAFQSLHQARDNLLDILQAAPTSPLLPLVLRSA
jgi:hypothetical protein